MYEEEVSGPAEKPGIAGEQEFLEDKKPVKKKVKTSSTKEDAIKEVPDSEESPEQEEEPGESEEEPKAGKKSVRASHNHAFQEIE